MFLLKIVYFAPTPRDTPRLGVYMQNRIIDLVESYKYFYKTTPPHWFYDLGEFLGDKYANKIVEDILSIFGRGRVDEPNITYDENEIMYYPITSSNQRIFCIALNYISHVQETGRPKPSRPYIFMKPKTALIGNREPILIPKISSAADHEIELGVIIGVRGKYISRKDALDYVAGYTVFNDMSFRDWQMRRSEGLGLDWLHGKSMDKSTPVGPYLVTKEEIYDPYKLRLELRVNGEVRQRGETSEMIFGIEDIIEEISQGITLLPGDLIATGTPSGVGHSSKRYLRDGDVIEAEISGVGLLINPVKQES